MEVAATSWEGCPQSRMPTRMDHDSFSNLYGHNIHADQQSSAKPCGALRSKRDNSFSCFPALPEPKGKEEKKTKERLRKKTFWAAPPPPPFPHFRLPPASSSCGRGGIVTISCREGRTAPRPLLIKVILRGPGVFPPAQFPVFSTHL